VRVQLDASLFEPPVRDASLVSFFNYALNERHRVEADLDHPAASAWLAEQSRGLQEEVRLAIDASVEAETREPAHTHVIVGRFAATDFTSRPLRVRLEDTAGFLEAPVSLLLEDQSTDRAFLLTMLTLEERRSFEKQAGRGYVRVDHGGGLGSMRTQVIERRQDPMTPHRLWVFFDSDALRPNTPSSQSEALRTACGDVPHYQLSRRQIESYIPQSALSTWASDVKRAAQRRRRAVLNAFLRMRPEQRHHFNLKAGFARDAQRTDATAGDLYNDVPDVDKARLANGFGAQIGTLFQTGYVTEADLRRDSGWKELRPVVQTLFAFLR
jgi:hypothetical protein